MHDVYGFFETMVEYYTGRDASQMTDRELAMKVAHIHKIREMENQTSIAQQLSLFSKFT